MNKRIIETKYWNPFLETLNLESIRKLQLKRFKDILGFACAHSKLYREFFQQSGVSPGAIKDYRDICKVPCIEKTFFESQDNDNIYGDSLAVPAEEIVYFHQTSGTTHRPLRQPDTLEDWNWWAECWATVLWSQGIRARDKVLFPFSYSTFIGFWGAHYACEKIGCEIISTGNMTTQERLQKIQELKVTAVITTPTYAYRMLEKAREELELDMATSSVEKIICAGEPGALIPSTKKELENQWGCKVLDHIGATEVGAWGFECNEEPGGIHVNESMFLVELLELDSDEIIHEPGKYGRLIITAFHRKARPVIRFDTRDLACWDEKGCKCGRTFRLLKGGIQGRADHLLKVRGTFVTPAIIENIVREQEGVGVEYQIIIGEKKNDSLKVAIEMKPELPLHLWKEIEQNISERIHLETHLRFEVQLKKYGEISRGNFKSKRLIDKRSSCN